MRRPFVSAPDPGAFVARAGCQQTQAHGVIEQFKNKLRRGGVCHAKLFPIHTMLRLRLAQMQQQTVTQFAHGHGWFLREKF